MAETIHDGDFYVTGIYSTDAEGGPVIDVGDLAVSYEVGIAVAREYESEIRLAQEVEDITLHRFRLVDEGSLLDLLNETANGAS